MDNQNGMTRREALKRMGTVAMSAALATSGFASVSELTTDKRIMKIVAINGSSRKDATPQICCGSFLENLKRQDMTQS